MSEKKGQGNRRHGFEGRCECGLTCRKRRNKSHKSVTVEKAGTSTQEAEDEAENSGF